MAINRSELNNAFREAIASEFVSPTNNLNETKITFSDSFNQRMTNLINSQRKPYYKLVNTAAKRVAIIFLLILTVLTTALGVKAIREPIFRFIKQMYESFIHYTCNDNSVDKIQKEYTITNLPEGFEKVSVVKNKNSISTNYISSRGDTIQFTQMTTNSHSGHFFDNETGEIYSEIMNGITVEFKIWKNSKSVSLINHGYIFIIDVYGDISIEDLKQIITSIE